MSYYSVAVFTTCKYFIPTEPIGNRYALYRIPTLVAHHPQITNGASPVTGLLLVPIICQLSFIKPLDVYLPSFVCIVIVNSADGVLVLFIKILLSYCSFNLLSRPNDISRPQIIHKLFRIKQKQSVVAEDLNIYRKMIDNCNIHIIF